MDNENEFMCYIQMVIVQLDPDSLMIYKKHFLSALERLLDPQSRPETDEVIKIVFNSKTGTVHGWAINEDKVTKSLSKDWSKAICKTQAKGCRWSDEDKWESGVHTYRCRQRTFNIEERKLALTVTKIKDHQKTENETNQLTSKSDIS